MQHLDDHRLQAWQDRDRSGIGQAEAAEVEDHVADCEACAARLAELEASSTRARSLLAVAAPAAEGTPDFGDVVRRARRRDPARKGGRWRMAVGWAASLIMATGLGWLSHDLLSPGPEAGTPTAAAELERFVAAAPPRPDQVEPGDAAAAREADAGVSATGEELAATPPAATDQTDVAAEQGRAATDAARAAAEQARAATDAAPPGQVGAKPGSLRVQGQVRAEDGRPLGAAQVMIEGSALGTVTGADGTFSISVPAGALAADSARPLAVIARHIGFASDTLEIDPGAADTASVDFRLETVALRLGELVVTGVVAGARAVADTLDVLRRSVEPREVWTPATRAHAESQAGFALLIAPELAIVEIELGEVQGAVAVRVRQALDSGATLTLVQQGADDSAGEPTLPAGQPAETVERNGLRITASAPIAVDSLRVLLDRVR